MFIEEMDNGWPDYERFPYNYADKQVASVIQRDLDESKNPMIITGYASLNRIINFLAKCHMKLKWNPDAFETIRILLGHEPYPTQAQEFRYSGKFSQEIEDYWLDRGISILKCGKVIAAIELIKNGNVQARIGNEKPIHAKIYNGDNAITLGSSNYSHSGLCWQIEGNVRFKRTKENTRFHEACQLAESIWELGRNYNEELIKLLEQLLSKVSWQEALAKACAELLEGEWAKKYKPTSYLGDEPQLWPSQEKGIAQAIWVIENVGSVLIADATGSGKTRMGAHLIKGVINKIWGTGRMRKGSPVLICPPNAVQESWEREFRDCDYSLKTYSYGLLSKSNSSKHDDVICAIRRGQVLAIDEAHKFLNRQSRQTQALFSNMADYVLLFTATPINRGPLDLLAIIELLGADNFDDEVMTVLELTWKGGGNLNKRMPPEVRDKVRRAIQQFTVRRTKTMLNGMINEDPERYKDRFDKQCRYPEHKAETYPCGETDRDRTLAKEIREATQNLQGLVNLGKTIKLPKFLRKEGWTDEKYLECRRRTAKLLAAYQVMVFLRSSRAALLEHLYGTDYVQEEFGLSDKVKAKESGNIIKTLQEIAGKPPKNQLQIKLPPELSDPAEHKRACDAEIATYEKIAKLTHNISQSREETKAKRLIELLKRHQLVIAFDSHPITLSDIKHRLEKYGHREVIVATGATTKERKELNEKFQLGSETSGVIALCSDAMSEGVNLQQASAVVLLDMPSVIRLAEQRIGRVDRMDSPHRQIEAWWPKDSAEFAVLSSERKFLERHGLVSDLLGSNVPLPENLSPETDTDSSEEPVELQEFIAELNNERYELGDVFDPVRSLVEGDRPLVSRQVYEQLRARKARVVSSVSFVEAKHAWAFFAIAGTEWGAPRWVYLDNPQATPITDLEQISQKLRENLDITAEDRQELDNKAATLLKTFLKRLKQTEEQLLPKKKQRALKQMRQVLKKYKDEAATKGESERERLVMDLLSLTEMDFGKQPVDLSILAERWLDLIRPLWIERLKEPRRKPLRLGDIDQDLIKKPIKTEELREALDVPKVKPLDERIVAAIVGVQ